MIHIEVYDLFVGVIGIGLDRGYKRIRYKPRGTLFRKQELSLHWSLVINWDGIESDWD